jgi:DNA-binding transcriptional LysR family regulator
VRLVERTTRRLSPTDYGLALADRARALLAEYDAATKAAAAAPLRGLLRVTAPVQFGRLHVAPLVASFLDAHPAISIELMLHDRNLDLIEEGLDVAIRIGALPDSTLLMRQVGEVSRVLVASPAYLARRGTPRNVAALAGYDTIFTAMRSGAPEWRFGPGAVVHLAPRLLVNEVEAQLIAARSGRGIARLPVQVVVRGGRHMAPKIRAFLDHAVDGLRRLELAGQTSLT